MKVTIVNEISPEVEKKLRIGTVISDWVESQLSDKSYGNGLKEIIACINCVNPNLGGRNPNAKDFATGTVVDKQYVQSRTYLEFSIKLNYFEVLNAIGDTAVASIIAEGLLKGCTEVLQKPIPDFDGTAFYRDLQLLLQREDWDVNANEAILNAVKGSVKQTSIVGTIDIEAIIMSEPIFWSLMNYCLEKTNYHFLKQINLLLEILKQTSEKDIIGFELRLKNLLKKADIASVLAIAKEIDTNLTDHGWLAFRCNLIMHGEKIYLNALAGSQLLMYTNNTGDLLLAVADRAFSEKVGAESDQEVPSEIGYRLFGE